MSLTDPSLRPEQPFRVFISYSRKDEAFLKELQNQLSSLIKGGWIKLWTDLTLAPGVEWKPALQDALAEA